MRNYILFLFLLISSSLYAQERQVIDMNFDWEFSMDSLFKESELVDVPHDFQIDLPWVTPNAYNSYFHYSMRAFKEMGTGWYRKTFVPDTTWKDRRVDVY